MQRHVQQLYSVEIREHGSEFVRWIEVEAESVASAKDAASQRCAALQFVSAVSEIQREAAEIKSRRLGFLSR